MASYKLLFKKSVAKDLRNLPRHDIKKILESITALASECIISDSEEAVAVSIPNPTTVKSSEIVVKKINNSESFVTITPSTGTIEGELTFVLRSSNKYVRLISDGVEWHVIANN